MAILYITQQGAALHKSGNQVIVKKGREVLQEIPIVHLDEVVIFGNGHIHAIELQVQHLARVIMEEESVYKPFRVRA